MPDSEPRLNGNARTAGWYVERTATATRPGQNSGLGNANVARARRYLETFATWDLDAMRGFFDPQIAWHVGGSHPLSGDYQGIDELIDYLARVRTVTDASLRLDADKIIGDTEHVAIFMRTRARRGTKTLDVMVAELFRVNPDGSWAEFWAIPDDQPAVDAFWS
jgi:ketosteroid isomerase-like protein